MRSLRRVVQALAIAVVAIAALLVTLGVHGYGLMFGVEHRDLLPLRVRPHASLVARGRHLAEITCVDCHSARHELPLAGSRQNFLHEPGGPDFGVVVAPNVTPGARIARASDAEVGRAIREGIGFDHRPLIIMPSGDYRSLSDRDLAALVAYLRSQPAVADTPSVRRFTPLAFLVLGAQAFETSLQRPVTRPVPALAEAPTPQYGEYVVKILGCATCHGADFHGGRSPLLPRGPDLGPIVAERSVEPFAQALREGVGRGGRALDPRQMPWTTFRRLTDVEVRAAFLYLRNQTGSARPGP